MSGRRRLSRVRAVAASSRWTPEFDALARAGGREVKMPFWKDLTATRQLLSDSASLTVNKITARQDIARIHNDAQVWSVNHLAEVISGDDPMQAIVDLVGGYWARTDEVAGHLVPEGDVRARRRWRATCWRFIRSRWRARAAATRLNGAHVRGCVRRSWAIAADRLTAVAMHSATEAALRKLDLIDFIPDSEGKAQLRTFQGRRVVVDDNLPTRAGTTDGTVYTTYLFGQGAFAKGVAPLERHAAPGRVRDGRAWRWRECRWTATRC